MAAADACQILWVGQQKDADQFSQTLESVDIGSHSPPVNVQCVETGAQAIAHLTSERPIDGVLLDLPHSEPPNFDLLHRLQTLKPQLPVVVIVDHNGQGLEAVQVGAEDYWIRADRASDSDDTDLFYTMLCAIERRRRSSGALVPQVEGGHRALNQEQRYQSIFQNVPVSLWEEDWSAVIAMVRALKAQGVTAIDRYLDEHPEFIDRALKQITILDVNTATMVMFKVATKAELMTSLDQVFLTPDTLPEFKQQLIALFNGEPGLDTETVHRAFDGEIINTLVRMTFPPLGDDSGLVLVSLVDITARKQAEVQLEVKLRAQVRQQQTVAHLGLTAIETNQLEEIFRHTSEQVAAVLEVEFLKILQLVPDSDQLLLVAGVGWQPGLVGTATVDIDADSQVGFTLRSHTPIYFNNLTHETRFHASSLLIDHGIISGMGVAIRVQGKLWGMLGAHSCHVRQFSDDDTHFMQSVASLLALTIERITIQQALRESNRQSAETKRLAALGRWDYDIVNDHFSWSENCFTVTGLDPAQFVSTYEGYLLSVHPDDQGQARQWIQQAIEGEQRLPPLEQYPELDFEHRWITPQGEVRYLHQCGEVIADANGQLLRLVGTFQDITQRRQTEETYYQQATLLVNAERLGKMGCWDRNLVNDRMVWSEGTYHLFGLIPGDPVPNFEQFLAQIVPDDRPRVIAAHHHADEVTGVLDVDYRICFPNGEIRWFYERGNVRFNETGQPVRRLGMVMDITEQKIAEAALRESEERFRHLFRDAATGIAVTTLEGQFLEANTAYCRMLGYTEAELRQLDFSALTHSDDCPDNPELLQELLTEQRQSAVIEKRYVSKSETEVWTRLSLSFQHNAQGQAFRIITVAEDITQQRQAETALERSEALLRAASHISRTGGWWVEVPEMTLSWSAEMFAIFEVSQDYSPVIDETIFWYVPEHRESIRQAFTTCVEQGVDYDLELEIITHSGNRMWTRVIGEAVRDASGQIVRVQGAFQDISTQKAAETALRESEKRFRMLSKATNDAIWDWDWASNHTWRGEGYTSLFGYSVGDIGDDGDWWRDRLHPDDRQRVLASFQNALDSEYSVWSDGYRFRCYDGNYAYVSDRGYILRNSEGQPLRIIGGMVNLTEQKNLEAQLLQSQKMEAVGHLAGGIAHDFNNLLTVILGCSEMLLSEIPSNASQWAIATDIYTAGERAAELTYQLLAFSRKQMLAPQIIDLNHLVSNQERMLRRVIGEDIHIDTAMTTPLPAIKVDRPQLEQVILNLAINARDAMPQGGKLILGTALEHISENDCLGNIDCDPGIYVVLTVKDTGEGVPSEIKAHIFDPFFTTKPLGQGTGLGLATVFGVVKQSGGFIEVHSEPGQGSCFKLLFPAVEAAIDASPTVLTVLPQGRETILLVEDEASVRQVAKMALDNLGYNTLEAPNGRAALQIVEQYTLPIDLVITDVVMPELSGREFVDQLRRRGNVVRVLYISGYTDDAIVRGGVIHDAVSFLQKPFTPSTLAQKVRDILEKPLPQGH